MMTEVEGPASAEITGQEAIDQLTAEIRGGFVRLYTSSGDLRETAELHLCEKGAVRYHHVQSFSGMAPLVVERFGQPWSVVEAMIRGDESYRGARLRAVFTYQRRLASGQQEITEPYETLIEWQNGQWYWGGQAVETGQASCAPTV